MAAFKTHKRATISHAAGKAAARGVRRPKRRTALCLSACLIASVLAGCVVAGPNPDDLLDTNLVTASIAPPAAGGPTDGALTIASRSIDARGATAAALNPYPGGPYSGGSDPTDRNRVGAVSIGTAEATSPNTFAAAAASSISDAQSDARTVRNAVSTADIADTDGHFAWANPQTGAIGVISALSEERDGIRICRRFKTSRQSFDGVALYQGEACTNGEGEWALVRFAENRA